MPKVIHGPVSQRPSVVIRPSSAEADIPFIDNAGAIGRRPDPTSDAGRRLCRASTGVGAAATID